MSYRTPFSGLGLMGLSLLTFATSTSVSVAEKHTPKWTKPVVHSGGYPIPMGFRRISSDSLDDILYQGQVVVGTATRSYRANEKLAHEFKRRRPEARVLVQYFWNAFPRSVPLQVARASKFRLANDPVYYPFPEFNGFYLCQFPAVVKTDIDASVETLEVDLEMTGGWSNLIRASRRHRQSLKALIYSLDENGEADFTKSEFVRLAEVDLKRRRATIERLPETSGCRWHSYTSGRARIGLPSVVTPGAVFFYPNLTRFCPRDPKTGMRAVDYWSHHIATYFRKRLDGLDGLAFDVPPFAPHKGVDIDNDGHVDNGYHRGVNEMGLGLYDFFDALRNGTKFDPGVGDDFVISVDGQEMADQRFPDLTNGAENEDFPGFMDFSRFSEQFNSHLWWCEHARQPNTSYPVMRFPTNAYHNAADRDRLLPYMTNGHARLGIATACFGNGIVSYEASRVWIDKKPVANLEATAKTKQPFVTRRDHYPWDEYHAGQRMEYGWLGRPIAKMTRVDDHLGPELLKDAAFSQFTTRGANDPAVAITEPVFDQASRGVAFAVQFRGAPKNGWTSMAGPRGPERLEDSTTLVLESGPLNGHFETGDELCLSISGRADTAYRAINEKYRHIPIPIGYRIISNSGDPGPSAWLYLDGNTYTTRVTLVAPTSGPLRLQLLAGTEPGAVELTDLSLRRGCAEVAGRAFENGLVLMNGSAREPVTIDLSQFDAPGPYKRLDGIIDPTWNNGRPVGKVVELPAREALFLERVPQ